ncbi:MAG: signal peptidase I [Treponema sp.]|jgi:signal peptidase I|nr:signal peptidase I [Treponema sp.]
MFFDKALKYSYAEQKNKRHRIRGVMLWFLGLFVLYNSFTSFFFSMRVLENDSMQPGLRKGDRFICLSFTIHGLLSELSIPVQTVKRGNIVLIETSSLQERQNFPRFALDWAIRFFTAQRFSLLGREHRTYLKRIVGLPGDEISMTNFVLRVREEGSFYTFTEFELSDRDYVPDIPHVPAIWDASLPFSGNMERLVLGEDECFVLSDDRSNTNDSRTWGPVPLKRVSGKALFRYWPLNRLGLP